MYGPDEHDIDLALRGLKQESIGGRIVPIGTKPYASYEDLKEWYDEQDGERLSVKPSLEIIDPESM